MKEEKINQFFHDGKYYCSPFVLEFYLATSENPFYTGQEPVETIARHIVTSSGPSGTNREYLYRLASAVRELLVMDEPNGCDRHLFELENLVRGLEQGKSQQVMLVDGQHDTSK